MQSSTASSGGEGQSHGEPDPRVRLANERTFLAWVRTALALIGGGLVVSQLARRTSSEIIALISSLALIGFGAVICLYGYRYWKRNETALRLGQPLEPSALPGFLAYGIAWFALAAAVLAVLRVTS